MKITIIRKEHEKLFSSQEILVLICLLLSFMDFKLFSMHLMVLAFGVFCVLRTKLPAARGVIPACLLSLALLLFWSGALLSPTVWVKRMVWPAAFLLGYGLVWTPNEESGAAQKRANVLLTLAAVGFLTHLLLNIYINWGNEATGRNTVDFWMNRTRAATGQAGLACVPLAYFVAYLAKNRKFWKKVPAFLAVVVIMYYNLTLGSRTLVLTLAVLLAVLLIVSFLRRKNEPGKRRGWLAVAGVVLALILLYACNVWGIRDLIEESNLFIRLFENEEGGLRTSRWEYKLEYIKRMPRYLFGGGHIYKELGAYAHDVLLDTYDEAGILAFAAVIALLWDGVAKLIRMLGIKRLNYETKITFVLLYVSVFLTFAIEPIIAGEPWLLMTYCFFHGAVTGLINIFAKNTLPNLQAFHSNNNGSHNCEES